MAENTVQKLLLGFLVLIVGIVLISTIASNTLLVTEKIGVASETIDISTDKTVSGACPQGVNGTNVFTLVNAPTGWKITDCPITSFSMANQTGVAATVTTDYVFFANNGTLFLKNTTIWGDCSATANATTATYNYCSDEYLNSTWGRAILNLVAGFFALALLGASVGLFYSVAKDAGIVN